MQGQHTSVLFSKAAPFHPSPHDLPPDFPLHTVLVPPPRVPRGWHNFLLGCVEESRAAESNGPFSEP